MQTKPAQERKRRRRGLLVSVAKSLALRFLKAASVIMGSIVDNKMESWQTDMRTSEKNKQGG
jgi:cell division protein FtsL